MGLSGLPWLFTAAQMHLHWGSGGPSQGGSEHTVNGLSADAEVCSTGVAGSVFGGGGRVRSNESRRKRRATLA